MEERIAIAQLTFLFRRGRGAEREQETAELRGRHGAAKMTESRPGVDIRMAEGRIGREE